MLKNRAQIQTAAQAQAQNQAGIEALAQWALMHQLIAADRREQESSGGNTSELEQEAEEERQRVQGANRRNQLGQLHEKNDPEATKSGTWAAQEAALLVHEHSREEKAAEKQTGVSTAVMACKSTRLELSAVATTKMESPVPHQTVQSTNEVQVDHKNSLATNAVLEVQHQTVQSTNKAQVDHEHLLSTNEAQADHENSLATNAALEVHHQTV